MSSETNPPSSSMEPEVYARIRQALSRLTPTKLAVAEYLLTRVEDAAFWSAARLAQAVGVSESVVVRLAVDLGYKGYPELQAAMQDLVRERLRMVDSSRQRTAGEGGSILQRAFSSNYRVLAATEGAADPAVYGRAASALVAARRIVTVGMRMSHAPAQALAFALQMVLGNATALTMGADVLEDGLRWFGPGDVAVICDVRPYNSVTCQVAHTLRQRGVDLIALTDSPLAPVAEGAVAVLLTTTEGDYRSDRSLVGVMAVVSALTALVCEEGGARCEDSVRETMSLRMEFRHNLYKR